MNEPKESVTLTRQALYELIWATPIDRLAKDYGISGRGLQKICERLDIPTPPRGYWAKLTAGKKVVKFRLPPPNSDTPLEATIRPSSVPDAPGPVSAKVQTVIDLQRADTKPVAVPKTLRSVHPIIQRWLDESHTRAASAKRFGQTWVPEQIDSTALAKRRLRILSALFFAVEAQGGKIKTERDLIHAAYVEVKGTRVDFTLKERIRKSRVPLSPEELKESWIRDRKWKQVETATGELVFRITSKIYHRGLPTVWQDQAGLTLEDQLSEVVIGIVGAAAQLAEQEQQRLAAELLRREEELRRYEEDRRKKIEANRFKHVMDMSERWLAARNGRQFLDRLEQEAIAQAVDGVLAPSTVDWFVWARKMFDKHDPLGYVVDSLVGYNEQINEWNYGR